MAKTPLLSFALVFAAGFGFGFMYHHIASLAHEAIASESGDSLLPRLRSVEARLAVLEASKATAILPVLANGGAATTQRLDRAATAMSIAAGTDDGVEARLLQRKLGATSPKHRASSSSSPSKTKSLWFFVPPGVKGGEEVTVQGPSGSMVVTVPEGKVAGDKFEIVLRDSGGCPPGRKPYHIVLTAQDNLYQAWQTRIMYYHFQKLQRADPCSEMTGFTRLLSSPDGGRDAMSDKIPTVHAKMLSPGTGCQSTGENTCDMGFPVMNRPHAVTQFLAQLPASLTEEYVLIAETDHLFLKEPRNLATPTKPVCFPFGYVDCHGRPRMICPVQKSVRSQRRAAHLFLRYMNAKAPELRPLVAKWAEDPDEVDPCGPSPILIHLPQLRKLTPEWLALSFKLKRDEEADKVFGWVLEMWGYTIAASRLGIRHLVWNDFQTEPSSLWHSTLDGDPHIYHYTFGLEYTLDGLPVTGVGDWSLDKRHFMGQYPPRHLDAPPKCAGRAAATLTAMFNEASAAIGDWPEDTAPHGTLGWANVNGPSAVNDAPALATEEAYQHSKLAKAVVARGAWQWAGKTPVLFFRSGRIYTPWGSGTWSIVGDAHHDAHHEAISVALGDACATWHLTFSKDVRTFTATRGKPWKPHTTKGTLAKPHANDASLPPEPERADGWETRHDQSAIAKRLIGSGPWAWQAVAPLAFLPNGRLFTPWGRGVWWPHDEQPNVIQCNFVGQKHVVTFDECWSFTSVREKDGDQATGTAKIEPPPKECKELQPGSSSDDEAEERVNT